MKRNDIIGLIFALIGLNILSLLLVNLTYNGYFEMQQMALKNLAALYSQNFNLSAILSTGMAYISFIVIVVLFFCLGKYGISRFFPEKKKKRKKKPQNKAHKKQANKIVPKSTSIQKAPVKKPTPKPATPQKAPVKKPTPSTNRKPPIKK